MATKIVTRDLASGWQADLYIGCRTNRHKKVVKGTADKVISFWGVTEGEAEQKAKRYLE